MAALVTVAVLAVAWSRPPSSPSVHAPPTVPCPPPLDFLAEAIASSPTSPAADLPIAAAELDAMVADGIAWAASHGMLVHARSPPPADASPDSLAPPHLVHAPFSLLPAAFPAEQLALASSSLAPLFGELVERVGRDVPWLAQTLKGAAAGDDFTRRLLKLCAQVQREGSTQPARLSILRSDYMLHEPEGSTVGSGRLLQVELNTIAASFASLGARAAQLHTHLAQRWPGARRHVWRAAGEPSTLRLRNEPRDLFHIRNRVGVNTSRGGIRKC